MDRLRKAWFLLLFALPLGAQGPDTERIEALVHQLGAEDSEMREAASDELREIGRPALDALTRAARSADPEVRIRAADLLPRIRWGLQDDCPDAIRALLVSFETADAARRAEVLRQLAAMRDPAAAGPLYAAWWDVSDPKVLASLARARIDADTDLVEERLRAVEAQGDPDVLLALATTRRFREDASEAADLYARVAKGEAWAQALFDARRYEELVKESASTHWGTGGIPLRIVESLYRLGRRDEAEGNVRSILARPGKNDKRGLETMKLATRYGSSRRFLTAPEGERVAGAELAARGWILEREFDCAEAAWRRIEDPAASREVLLALLEARGDLDLLTPAFLAEAVSHETGAAARHLRLSSERQADDPDTARIERKKAHLLDPSSVEEQHAPSETGSGFGGAVVARPEVPRDLLFASDPVRIGEFWYFANRDGDLVKTGDPASPRPAWVYSPPKGNRVNCRGWAFAYRLGKPAVARWNGKLVALFSRVACTGSGDERQSSTSSTPAGYVLCVLDEETGHEAWSRIFPYFKGGRLFPDEGLVAFADAGLVLFDLARRDWKWSITGLEGLAACWVQGDAVYLGLGSGVLARLSAADGSLLWRKSWPSIYGGRPTLEGAASRLLFCVGRERLVCLSIEDDRVLWESQFPSVETRVVLLTDEERVYVCSETRASVVAYSLADGSLCWRRRARRYAGAARWGLADKTLFVASMGDSPGACTILDPPTGSVLGAAYGPTFRSSSSWFEGGGLLFCAPSESDSSRLSFRGPVPGTDRAPLLLACRFVPGPAPVELGALDPPTDEDPLAVISLLEDACAGRYARDGGAWRALAEACLKAGHAEWAVEPTRRWMLFSEPDAEELREWSARVDLASATQQAPMVGDLSRELSRMADDLERERAFRAGRFDGDPLSPVPPGFRDCFEFVEEGPPDLAIRRAAALAREGCLEALPLLAKHLDAADDQDALVAMAAIVREGTGSSGTDSKFLSFSRRATVDSIRDALMRAAERRTGPPRGAALAILDLMGDAPEAQDSDAALRAAFTEGDPILRLAAAAALARRGSEDARRVVLDAIGVPSGEERKLAVWLAMHLRMEDAVGLLSAENRADYASDRAALASIGTEEAWDKVLDWAESSKGDLSSDLARAMGQSGKPRALELLLSTMRKSTDHRRVCLACGGLLEAEAPEARDAALQFLREYLRMDTDSLSETYTLAKAALADARLDEARLRFTQLQARVSPSWWFAALESELLAAERDLDGAREARRVAVERLLRSRAIEPESSKLLVDHARLWLSPKAIAEPERAIPLLEEALRLDPRHEGASRMRRELEAK